MLLGSFGQFEEFFLGSILCANAALLIKLAEVIDIVNVIADALQSNARSDASGTENGFRGASTSLPAAFVGARVYTAQLNQSGVGNRNKLRGIQRAVIPM